LLLEGETLVDYAALRSGNGGADEAHAYLERARDIFRELGALGEREGAWGGRGRGPPRGGRRWPPPGTDGRTRGGRVGETRVHGGVRVADPAVCVPPRGARRLLLSRAPAPVRNPLSPRPRGRPASHPARAHATPLRAPPARRPPPDGRRGRRARGRRAGAG